MDVPRTHTFLVIGAELVSYREGIEMREGEIKKNKYQS